MKTPLLITAIALSITGCAAPANQSSATNIPADSAKIVLDDRTGNVDGHKTPFAKEYIVPAGNHVVGVCNPGLCEKYYYIRFNAKPGYTYTVDGPRHIVYVSNQSGNPIYSQGFSLQDGPPVLLAFEPTVVLPNIAQPTSVHVVHTEQPAVQHEPDDTKTWEYLGEDSNVEVYVAKDRIRRHGHDMETWQKFVNKKPMSVGNIPYDYAIYNITVHCSKNDTSDRLNSATIYRADGTTLLKTEGNKKWEENIPDTTGDHIAEAICSLK